jgi:hypothetical protein
MELNRHIQVLWRGKLILLMGALLGVVLASFANFKVPSMEPRKAPVYTSATKLLLTQNGFPWGRTTLPGTGEGTGATAATGPTDDATKPVNGSAPEFADPSRLANLAWMYSHFLMGDEIRASTPNVPEDAIIDAAPLTAGGNMSAGALPLIGLTISAPTAADAQRLSKEVPAALERYLTKQQQESRTPGGARVEIAIVNRSKAPLAAPSKAPMMALVMVMMAILAAIALVYVRENLRLQRGVTQAPTPEKERRVVEPMPEPAPKVAVGDAGGWASGPPPTSMSRISRSSNH